MQSVSANITGLAPDTLYHYKLTMTNAAGITSTGDGTFTTQMSAQQTWRLFYFGNKANAGNGANTEDPDKDGIINVLEWACDLSPTTSSELPISVTPAGANIEFIYNRSIAAVTAGAQFQVEWSETLAPDSWSPVGVTETITSTTSTAQIVKALVPTGTGTQRFMRLKVVAP